MVAFFSWSVHKEKKIFSRGRSLSNKKIDTRTASSSGVAKSPP